MERIELHLYTTMSQMDGMTALAIIDHALVKAFPQAQKYLEKL